MRCTCPPSQCPGKEKCKLKSKGLQLIELTRPTVHLSGTRRPSLEWPTKLRPSSHWLKYLKCLSCKREIEIWKLPAWYNTSQFLPKTFCCGLSLRTGMIIIAICGMLGIGNFIWCIYYSPCTKEENVKKLNKGAMWSIIATPILSVTSLLFLIPLLVGRCKWLGILLLLAIVMFQIVNTYTIMIMSELKEVRGILDCKGYCVQSANLTVFTLIVYPIWTHFYNIVRSYKNVMD